MRYLFISLILLFSACNSEPEAVKKPDNLIPEEQMVQVLADVHLLEATLSIRAPGPRMPMNLGKDPSTQQLNENGKRKLQYYDIFKKYGLTYQQYDETMKWYCANPEELNTVYDQVLVELSRRQAEQQAGKAAKK